jgi:hypothetical protein
LALPAIARRTASFCFLLAVPRAWGVSLHQISPQFLAVAV